jgi:DNA-binding transcriptional MerR regulator
VEKVRYMISDAAGIVGVETHVLRYWEEELELTIPRNELGHRYYTRENIQEFQKIKELKEKGYQLKAIRNILHTGQLPDPPLPDVRSADASPATGSGAAASSGAAVSAVPNVQAPAQPLSTDVQGGSLQNAAPLPPVNALSAEERMAQFRELMSDIVGRAIARNNDELSQNISQEVRETVLKEMNYLFREQEDSEEERYKKLDAAIRGKVRRKHTLFAKKEKQKPEKKHKVNSDAVPTT